MVDVLAGWRAEPFRAGEVSHDVYRRAPVGGGPGVVLLPEIPGPTPDVMALADHLVRAGFTVRVPVLFGTPGRDGARAALSTLARVCVAREFRALARGAERPVATYVRALARDLHAEAGGPGVGVVGMCFTGGFALAAAVEPAVLAPVASQPSVPFPVTRGHRRDLGMSVREADAVAARTGDGLCLLGLRFSEDRAAPATRFDALRERFGDAFRVIEVDSSPGNAAGLARSAHSVLSRDLVEEPGHPTYRARDEVVAFLRERLTSHVTGA